MKHIKLYEQFVNESMYLVNEVFGAKPAILKRLYTELSKAKNIELIS